jgi:peptidoglycan hydrolase
MHAVNTFSPVGPSFAGLAQPQPNPMQQQMQALELQMAVLFALMQVGTTMNGNSAGVSGLASGANPGFGGSSGSNGVNSFLGGASPASSSTASSSTGGSSGGGSGSAAVDTARQFLNKDSISLKGKMKHFTAAGGVNNNCADFVSSALEGQGLLKGHHINVKSMEQELKKQGYRQVPASQAKPGDVWISNSRGHTELVATKGATRLIGSNNNGDSRQEITEHANRPGSGVIYQKG